MRKPSLNTLGIAFLLIAGVLLSVAFTTGFASAVPCTPDDPGDANGDGYIDAGDITKVERIIFGWDDETPGADANEDSTVNATDIGVIEYMILEIWPFKVVHLEMYDEEGLHDGTAGEYTNFTVVVYTTYVEDLASTQYDIVYDGSFLNVTKVTSGSILDSSTGTFYPVDIVHWGFLPPATQGRVRIINDLPGDGVGVNGSGYLSKVHFYVATSSCEASDINFSVNMTAPNLFDSGNNPILGVTWLNTSMKVFPCGGY